MLIFTLLHVAKHPGKNIGQARGYRAYGIPLGWAHGLPGAIIYQQMRVHYATHVGLDRAI